MGDVDAIEARLRAAWAAVGGVGEPQRIVIPGNPWAKLRPRHTSNGKTYQDPSDRAAEKRTREALEAMRPHLHLSNVAVVVAFIRKTRHTIDGDNMVKHLLDAAHGVLFENDNQVTGQASIVELDREHPRTVLLVGSHASSMDRTRRPPRPSEVLRKLEREASKHQASTGGNNRPDLAARVPARGKRVPTLVSYAQRKAIMDALDAGGKAEAVALRHGVSASFVYKIRRLQVRGEL